MADIFINVVMELTAACALRLLAVSGHHSMSLKKEEDCLQSVDYIASSTSLRRRDGVLERVAQQAQFLAVAALGESAAVAGQ